MTPQELIERIESGKTLTPTETALLDMYLDEGHDDAVAKAVRSLNQADPSLAWRSRLNERLLARSATPKRSRAIAWAGAFGAACVAAVFGLSYIGNPGVDPGQRLTAELILQWHEEAKASSILPVDSAGLSGFSEDHDQFESDDIDDLLYGDPLHSL